MDEQEKIDDLLQSLKLKKKKCKIKKKKEPQVSEVPDDNYKIHLKRLYSQLHENNPGSMDSTKTIIPPPVVTKVNSRKVVWANIDDTCKILVRDRDHVVEFLLSELGTTGNITQNSGFSHQGYISTKDD